MENIDGCYAADSVAVVGGHASAMPAVSEESGNQVISHVPYSFPKSAPKSFLSHGRINEASSPSTSKNFL